MVGVNLELSFESLFESLRATTCRMTAIVLEQCSSGIVGMFGIARTMVDETSSLSVRASWAGRCPTREYVSLNPSSLLFWQVSYHENSTEAGDHRTKKGL